MNLDLVQKMTYQKDRINLYKYKFSCPFYFVKCMIGMKELSCPYCESKFQDKEELSSHIDKLHIGPGLLEGDSRKF